jgi:hypothetical protein
MNTHPSAADVIKHEKIVELHRRIDFSGRQFLIAQQYANYWQAQATTGVAKTQHNTAHNNGDQLTQEEKVASVLKFMLNHIHRMAEISIDISNMRAQLNFLER